MSEPKIQTYRSLAVVKFPINRCEDCLHNGRVENVGRLSKSFAFLSCRVRAEESLQPHESLESLNGNWGEWNAEKWNADGLCARFMRPPTLRDRIRAWWHTLRSTRKD
jgi:hypothetical protein